MAFEFKRMNISDVILIKPAVFKDERGFFIESYKYSEFSKHGIKEHFVQDNHSRSTQGVLRGLHYQKNPSAQGKLVRCISGEIFDVAVDIRKSSPSYGKWAGAVLSGENMDMLYIPPGFAHGFLVLSETADLLYKTTEEYSPANDRGIFWNDPFIDIKWSVECPIVSEKDKHLPLLKDGDNNFL
jgi:dTDP-4-dehydrorhamnose 3,5-epimerase